MIEWIYAKLNDILYRKRQKVIRLRWEQARLQHAIETAKNSQKRNLH